MGEDLIVENLLSGRMGLGQVRYVDVGACHPRLFSNTYKFYVNGGRGLCIEANPSLCHKIEKARSRDVVVNRAVIASSEDDTVDALPFYVMSADTLSTADKAEAERIEAEGEYEVEGVIKVPYGTLPEIMRKSGFEKDVDFMSIDIECDIKEILEDILANDDINPKVLCVEIRDYRSNGIIERDTKIIEQLRDNNYMYYANTSINGIFINQDHFSSVTWPAS